MQVFLQKTIDFFFFFCYHQLCTRVHRWNEMSVTIKDIAKKAGVSHTTVSRALNGNPVITEKTAAVIRGIAGELGYLPSAAARGLKTRRSGVLGVLVSRIDNPYFGEIIQGIEDALSNSGYSIFIASSSLDPQKEKNIVQAFSEHRVDGVIIGSVPVARSNITLLNKYNIPAVFINNQCAWNQKFSISHDDEFGARLVTHHLLDLGHRRIAYLGNARAPRINENRLRGFQRELADAGLAPDERLISSQPGGEIEDGLAGMSSLLGSGCDFSAVFCFNDLMAVGALSMLQHKGLRVPADVSLAGFDNIPSSAYTYPPLTTFDQPKRSIGAEATGMLLELIKSSTAPGSNHKPITKMMRGELLTRESTAIYSKE